MNKRKCILVVDDDDDDVFVLRRGLEKAGLPDKLATVPSVEEALDYLAGVGTFSDRDQHPFPDLVLLDLKMPGINGFDMLCQLQSRPELSNLPVVVLSNSPMEADVEKARSLGAREYLIKPISSDEYREMCLGLHKRWLS